MKMKANGITIGDTILFGGYTFLVTDRNNWAHAIRFTGERHDSESTIPYCIKWIEYDHVLNVRRGSE